MIYKNTKSCTDIQFFFEKRYVFLNEGNGGDTPSNVSAGEIFFTPGSKGKNRSAESAEKTPANVSEKETPQVQPKEALASLKDDVEKRRAEREGGTREDAEASAESDKAKAPEKKVRRKLRTLAEGISATKKRIEEELFGKEEMKLYSERIKSAIEKFDPDKLHEFIQAHNSYSGDFRKWNQELCETFGLELDKEKPAEQEYMKYTAALQMYLAEYFASGKKADVFQTTTKANPFIYIDGKLGGYTMSVLAAYWNDKNQDKAKEKGALEYSQLEKTYSEQRKNNEVYVKAIDYLKAALAGKPIETVQANTPKPAADVSANETAKNTELNINMPLSAENAVNDKEWNDAMDRVKKDPGLAKTADFLTRLALSENNISISANVKDTAVKRFDTLKKLNRDPSVIYLSKSEMYGNTKYWPSVIFKLYREAYNKATNEPNPENQKRRDELFLMLFKSSDDYYNLTKSIVEKLKAKYESNIRFLIGRYSLPQNIGRYIESKELSPRYGKHNESSEQYSEMMDKVFPTELREQKKIDEFYKKYFKDAPSRTFSSWSELSQNLKSEDELKNYFLGESPDGIKNMVNNVIMLKNTHDIYWNYKWYKDEFNKELGAAISSLDSSFEDYYKNYSDQKGKDFVADIVNKIPEKKEKIG